MVADSGAGSAPRAAPRAVPGPSPVPGARTGRPAAVLGRAARDSLRETCRRAVEQARRGRRPVLATWAKPLPLADPVAMWSRTRRCTGRSLLWQSAWDDVSIVAIGTARDLRGRGGTRVSTVRDGWAALTRNLVTGGTAALSTAVGGGPLAVGGFAFRPAHDREEARLPEALMWVPALQVSGAAPRPDAERPGGSGAPGELLLNAVLLHDSRPDQVADGLIHLAELCLVPEVGRQSPYPVERTCASTELPAADDWKHLVRRAVGRIRAGDFEKVVLARELRVTASTPFDVPAAVRRLRAAYPGTTVFAVDHEEHTFLGATPEYLVRVQDRTVRVLGLAGTAPRGATPEHDLALERELAGSAKIRHEHDVVVRILRDALGSFCVGVEADPAPTVVKLANVQHLSTRVRGDLAAARGTGILDLVDRLHPTPALGGHPREESLSWLAANEGLDRGWYAGVVGWTDRSGQGQFAVTIRSALLDGPSASLYAGCGIVADSDPDDEYAESCAKLRPMLSALEIE